MSVYNQIEKRINIAGAESGLKTIIKKIRDQGPANSDIERMKKRFGKYGACSFTYLEHPGIMPDNNSAEDEICPCVIQC